MAREQQAIFSFSAGVLTPRLSLRADSAKFSQALLTGENWIVTPQGGAIFREGLQHVEITAQNRIFQFHQGGNESDIIVEIIPTDIYQAGEIHFHTDSSIAPIATVTGHSYSAADLEGLYFTNQERYAIITHPDFPPLIIEYKFDGTFAVEYFPAAGIPNFEFRDDNSPAASDSTDITYVLSFTNGDIKNWTDGRGWNFKYNNVFAATGTGRAKDYEYYSSSAAMVILLTDALNRIAELQGAGTSYSVSYTGAGSSPVVAIYEINIIGVNSGRIMEISPANIDADRYVSITRSVTGDDIVEPAWSYPTYVLSGSNYYQCIKVHTSETGVIEPPNATYWTDLGTTKPDTFDWQYPNGNPWTTEINYAPEGRGFPGVCVFHDQRLLFASSPSAPTSLWGSRIGAIRDFVLGVEDDDPFAFTLDTSDTPTIKWMSSQLDLIVGTSGGDWSIGAQVTLSPTDITAQKQNYARSHSANPVIINTDIFYIEQGANKLRMARYNRQQLGFVSVDASLIAEHLFHVGIKRIVVLRTPEVLLIALRKDGTLVAMTYGEDMAAYVEISSSGYYHDIAAYYSTVTNQDELWVTVSHGYVEGGTNNYYLEKMPYPSRVMTGQNAQTGETLIEQGVVMLDSWISGTCVNNVITGLAHLEGMEVGVIVEDAWTGTWTVNDGAIVLSDAGITNTDPYNGVCAVGFVYTGTLKTFELAPSKYNGSTTLGTKRRWNRLYVRLLDSALPKINGTLPPDRTPEFQMNIGEILTAGLRDVEIRQLGFGDGSVEFVQDRPYPTHILGMYGEFQTDNA